MALTSVSRPRSRGGSALVFALALAGCLENGDISQLSAPIVGGGDANIEDVPYQVALVRGDRQFCGGSILAPGWVLTAAHCIEPEEVDGVDVLAGVSKVSDAGLGQRVGIAAAYRFPCFITPTRGKDAALLMLREELDLTSPAVSAIALVDEAAAASGATEPGVLGKVSGWGVLDPGEFGPTDQLQAVEVPIITNEQAQASYPDKRITRDQLAAAFVGVGGKDACFGDSGGPYVVPAPAGDGVLLAGIVSWGESCARPEFPGMYGRVSVFADFIRETMANPPPPPGSLPRLVINEILADPEHDANGDGVVSARDDEFVEIVNVGGGAASLAGVTLADKDGVRVRFAEDLSIPAGGALVVFGGGSPKLPESVAVVTGALSLNNGGDVLTLADANGGELAFANYGNSANHGQSVVRKRDGDPEAGWVLHTKRSSALASPGTRADGSAFALNLD